MSDQPHDSSAEGAMRPPTEDELRAAYEEEMKRLRVEDVVVQTTISLMNLGARKAGLAPGSEDERDLGQVQMAIEGARVLLPLVEPQLGPNAAPIREALSQLQLAYAQLVGEAGAAAPEQPGGPGAAPPAGGVPQSGQPAGEEGRGPAQQSGRLWVPGQ